jgi:hypothetical protein
MKGNESRIRTIFRYCIRVAGCLMLAGFLWMGLIQDDQVRHARHIPDVQTGRIYPKRIHGGNPIYLTKSEMNHSDHVIVGAVALFCITLVGVGIYRNLWYMDEEFGARTSGLRGPLRKVE